MPIICLLAFVSLTIVTSCEKEEPVSNEDVSLNKWADNDNSLFESEALVLWQGDNTVQIEDPAEIKEVLNSKSRATAATMNLTFPAGWFKYIQYKRTTGWSNAYVGNASNLAFSLDPFSPELCDGDTRLQWRIFVLNQGTQQCNIQATFKKYGDGHLVDSDRVGLKLGGQFVNDWTCYIEQLTETSGNDEYDIKFGVCSTNNGCGN